MKLLINKAFTKDIKGLQNNIIAQLSRLATDIQNIHSLSELSSFRDMKKIVGSSGYYRIRIGDYRVGFYTDGDSIQLVRLLHRRDIYKYFPQ